MRKGCKQVIQREQSKSDITVHPVLKGSRSPSRELIVFTSGGQQITMSITTKRNIRNVSLVVLAVVLVYVIQDLYHSDGSLKNKLYRTPEIMLNLAKNILNIGPTYPDLGKLRRNGMVILPGKKVFRNMSLEALFQTYHSYLDNNDILCNRKLRMGKMGDGGWEVCDDKPYRPSAKCVAYSFGINNDYSFDDEISRVYNCSVISFDPSMKQKSYQRSPRVYFLQMGIAEKNYRNDMNWELRTFGFFLNKFNHTNRTIDVLKMDVEGAEWPSLQEMVTSGHLRNVKQLLMEYHGCSKCTNTSELISELNILKDIYDIGFRKFYVHKNSNCVFKTDLFPVARTHCYEVHYVNVNLL